MKKFVISGCFFVLTLLAFNSYNAAIAQCAMCKTTVESNQKEQAGLAKQKAEGLNTGILYLMVLPYIVFSVIGYMWYRNSKKERDERSKMTTA